MDIEDDYVRDYSFEPEFITRKDSLNMHRSRWERTRKHIKAFKSKPEPLDVVLERTLASEQPAMSRQNIVEAEVDAFQTVTVASFLHRAIVCVLQYLFFVWSP
jgi:hypothetical protein